MTQKAASLTSSLFARKGKASPARLLISELEAAGAESGEAAAETAAQASAARASARRRTRSAPELPLLAYVEAQEVADEAIEPPPAASLLDRGARSLRRVNGHDHAVAGAAPTVERSVAQPETAREAEAEEPVLAAQPVDEADDVEAEAQDLEPETISGDGNVAAIEDAPQDEEAGGKPAAETAVAAPADRAAGDPEIAESAAADPGPAIAAQAAAEIGGREESAAPETAASGNGPAETAEAPVAVVPPAAAPVVAASTVPASLALRKAAALQTPPPASAAVVPPPAPTSGLAWRSAAVIAFGAALGLGLYLALSGEPAVPPVASVSAPAPAAAPAGAAAIVAVPAEPALPEPAEASPAPPAPAAPAAALAALSEPSFDIIRIEPDGQSIIAGRAQPGSEWILLNNGSPIAAVRADANGEWVVLPDAALLPGANAFSLVPKDERGKVAIPAPGQAAPAPAPAAAEPVEGESAPASLEEPAAEPRAEAAEPAPALPVLPRPKPLVQAAAAPAAPATFEAAAAGPYEVQLASVRQSADANRERLRLSEAFPALLGGMDLRVQEARLEGSGVFYRVRSGAIGALDVARDLCRRLEAEGQGCLVVRRPEAPSEAVVESVPDAAAAVRQQAERPSLALPQ